MTIVKTTVTHQLISPSASVVQRSGIIRLGGFVGGQWRDIEGMTADGQVITWEPANADGTGAWSVDLIPNADVANPANTLYRYQPAQGAAVVFEVPQIGTPVTLRELVVTDPSQWPGLTPTTIGPVGPPGPPIDLQGHVADAAALPPSAEVGQAWITDDDDHVHIWHADGFVDAGAFRGPGLPEGGSTGQWLQKRSGALFDYEWASLPPEIDGGSAASTYTPDQTINAGGA